ncbi:hypothetical protein ITP53_22575 [Nonomuraea sp. K274]|uniref:Uncharacterized protein n=1 Tax=Nonomuraea cypriaca TaxID=1187855 RepID=A0A931ABD8_9ACTN|nr:hypothetical protein [Nonomuraea cypriaca]MBF8188460.1 hypothetical protein [Nonomuraea cypriaca]
MESVEERIARLEQQVANLHRHLGIDPALVDDEGPFLPPEFYQALEEKKLIMAIKIYRKATGASLLVAKNTVEAMVRRAGR